MQFSHPAAPNLLDAWTNEDRDFAGPSTDGFLKVHGYLTSVLRMSTEPRQECGYASYLQQRLVRLPIQDNVVDGRYNGLLITNLPVWALNNPERSFHFLRMWDLYANGVEVLQDDHRSWNCQIPGLGLGLVNEERQEYKRLELVYSRPKCESWFVDCGEEVEITIKWHFARLTWFANETVAIIA